MNFPTFYPRRVIISAGAFLTFFLVFGLGALAWANIEATAHFNRALSLSKAEQWKEAIPEYQKTLELDPSNSTAQANLGVAFSRIDQHKEALLAFEKALKLGYDQAMFRYFRGLSFAKLNLLDEAVEEIKLALEMDSRLLEAKYDLGIIYQMQGRSDLAREQANLIFLRNPKLAKKLLEQVSPAYKYQEVSDGGTLTGTMILKGKVPKPRSFHLIHSPNIEYCSRISDGKGHRIVYDFKVDNNRGLMDTVIAIRGIQKGKPFPDGIQKLKLNRCQSDKYAIGIFNGEDILLENTDPIKHEVATYQIKDKYVRQISNKPVLPNVSQVRSAFIDHRAQEFLIRCNLHPFLQTRGFMVDNPYYTVTDAKGEFTITDIPPGTYQVAVWHFLMPVIEQTITIQPNKVTKLNFELDSASTRTKLYQDDTKGYRFNTWYDSEVTFYGDQRVDDPVEVLQKFDNSERYEN